MSMLYQNLLEPVIKRAAEEADSVALIFVTEEGQTRPVTYAAFRDGLLQWAAILQGIGLKQDEVLLLVLGHSLDLLYAFWGAIYLGAIPSIFPTPAGKMDHAYYAQQVRELVTQSQIRAVVTNEEFAGELTALLDDSTCAVMAVELARPEQLGPPPQNQWQTLSPHQIAFLQFSSGTTGAKKGVVISHQAILNQANIFSQMQDIRPGDIIISWLPLHHDMGLITGFLIPLVQGNQTILISPNHWIQDPKLLLQLVHRYRATHSWMPNFAYNYLVRAVRPRDLEGLNLSSWRQLLNGAEPIRWETMVAFFDKYTPYGLPPNALTTGYGMAENTLAIAIKPYDETVYVDWVNIHSLQTERRAVAMPAESPGSGPMVMSGRVTAGTQLIVADDQGQPLPERHLGEFWLKGDNLFGGYYRQPELTAELFADGWFKTGDLGYVAEGRVFVTGRKKDLIIVGGKNIHPEDIEEIANHITGIYPGRAVAFGLFDPRTATESVVMVCELVGNPDQAQQKAIGDQLRQLVAQRSEITLGDVRLVSGRWIIKSSSGKIARAANREKYQSQFYDQ